MFVFFFFFFYFMFHFINCKNNQTLLHRKQEGKKKTIEDQYIQRRTRWPLHTREEEDGS